MAIRFLKCQDNYDLANATNSEKAYDRNFRRCAEDFIDSNNHSLAWMFEL